MWLIGLCGCCNRVPFGRDTKTQLRWRRPRPVRVAQCPTSDRRVRNEGSQHQPSAGGAKCRRSEHERHGNRDHADVEGHCLLVMPFDHTPVCAQPLSNFVRKDGRVSKRDYEAKAKRTVRRAGKQLAPPARAEFDDLRSQARTATTERIPNFLHTMSLVDSTGALMPNPWCSATRPQ